MSEVVSQNEEVTETGSRLVRVSPKKGFKGSIVSESAPLVEEQVDFSTTYVHRFFPPKPHPEPCKDSSISQVQ